MMLHDGLILTGSRVAKRQHSDICVRFIQALAVKESKKVQLEQVALRDLRSWDFVV
jgi:hypothetical protein